MFCTNLTSMLLEAPDWIVRTDFDRRTITREYGAKRSGCPAWFSVNAVANGSL